MLTKFKSFSELLKHHIHEYTRPNPKLNPNKIQLELVHQRNKAYVCICLACIFFFFVNVITKNGLISTNIQGVVSVSIVLMIFLSTCRSHPELFRIVYNIINCFYGISLMEHGQDGIAGAWMATLVFPSLVYLFTGSLKHYLVNYTVQTIIMNTHHQSHLENAIREMDPEDLVKAFTYHTNQNIAFSMIAVILTHFMIENAYVKISEAETKRDNSERQKQFLLGFSHELRNLINSLMGNVKLATFEMISMKVKDLLMNAEVCSELLLHMVNNILDTGKVEIGDLEINPNPIRIYDTIERVWSVCSELIKRKSLRGTLKIQKDIPQVLNLDHYRLTQIFLNLIGNAVKFTDMGGIEVSVEWRNASDALDRTLDAKHFQPHPYNDQSEMDEGIFEKKQAFSMLDSNFLFLNFGAKKINQEQIQSTENVANGVLKIIVSDTGVGMSQEDIGKIFQRFTQVTSDVSKKKLGTGLGLFISKELCQRMKGEIRVYSKKGRGTAFVICLPVEALADEKKYLMDVGSMKSLLSKKNLRAMVVDDQAYNRNLVQGFLKNIYVNVSEIAENGLEAYNKFTERLRSPENIHLITLDLDMPIMNGKIAAQRIRELEKNKMMKPCMIIIISGNCVDSEIKECLDKKGLIKADAFLKKPINLDELCRVISKHYAQTLEKYSSSPFLCSR